LNLLTSNFKSLSKKILRGKNLEIFFWGVIEFFRPHKIIFQKKNNLYLKISGENFFLNQSQFKSLKFLLWENLKAANWKIPWIFRVFYFAKIKKENGFLIEKLIVCWCMQTSAWRNKFEFFFTFKFLSLSLSLLLFKIFILVLDFRESNFLEIFLVYFCFIFLDQETLWNQKGFRYLLEVKIDFISVQESRRYIFFSFKFYRI